MTSPSGYHDRGPVGVVTLTGEIDIFTAQGFRAAVEHACRMRHEVVEIDLTGVSFIDSSGLGLVAELLRHQRQHGGRVVVRGARRSVARTFRLCAMDTASDLDLVEADQPEDEQN
ncbi:MAG: anti-sigma factor antagonist [Frankiaceae bacterium]|nr:anti-sigma factor antagonist [Frankiaceae bacterium]MDX6223647.1 anti-sigma factor antagonist [Frankiales bacterium]MDX6275082.1 anti-sigma factor antagonist [Frankiales bacterium]